MSEISKLPCSVMTDHLELENARLRDALRAVLASAHPHPKEHPAMYEAFEQAREALATPIP